MAYRPPPDDDLPDEIASEYGIKERQRYTRNDDPECLKLIAEWMAECHERHPHCQGSEERALPSRVLDVYNHDGELMVRLKTDVEPSDRYIALSYCWGKVGNPMMLLLDNLADFDRGVSVRVLPKTIKDAATVTNILGYRYLWVDALCIIQNSESDKSTELSKMHAIYENSYLTIAAADGEDSQAGILSSRDLTALTKQVHFWNPVLQRNLSVHLRTHWPSEQDRTRVHGDRPPEAHLHGPLSSRAWTLQERILPHRVLHYTATELVWECNTKTAWEGMLPVFETEHLLNAGSDDPLISTLDNSKALIAIMNSAVFDGRVDSVYALWHETLEDYTRRKMTFDRDKITAIGGIASVISQRTGDTLISGLWENDVLRSLLWRVVDSSVEVKPTALSMPSWSWAKTHGLIFCGNLENEGMIAEVDNSQMRQGKLVVTGRCEGISSKLIEEIRYNNGEKAQGESLKFERGRKLSVIIHPDNLSPWNLVSNGPWTGDIFFMVISETGLYGDDARDSTISGLVLIENDGSETFARVGFFESKDLHRVTTKWPVRTITLV